MSQEHEPAPDNTGAPPAATTSNATRTAVFTSHYTEAPGLMPALRARDASHWRQHVNTALARRDEAELDNYIAAELRLPRGPQWDEAIVSVLQDGNERWFRKIPEQLAGEDTGFPLAHSLVEDVSTFVRHQARREHRVLVPVWSHRVGGRRLVSLDMQVGESGIRLHDLVAGGVDPQQAVTGLLPEDPRLAAVLEALEPGERAVALAWASWNVAGWEEAALLTGATDPAAMGERVRRKLKRLGRALGAQQPEATR